MTADQLRECPLCGSSASMRRDFDSSTYRARCDNEDCACEGPEYMSEATASQRWNTRPTAVASHAEGEVVAWLHDVVQGDGEPDQALSFMRDSFPLEGELGFRSLGSVPLYLHPPRSGDEAKDAARYRFLRECKSDDYYVMAFDPDGDAPCLGGEIMDNAIDAAMAAQGGEKAA